ncbi:molybdopterin converting factor subunit 1 [Usitatibacter palustris]|uniref:Molybdopterin synthase sulfur carrier subunit n=1 Tax=Usitatibacter palustris TaxID=2732487 RepID=A0A6M4H5Y5_9PROT|nr:molybdopterin converting factor subunit 1 [Usitatibacter palustris]QJR15069.1 Molybdopterin synthase sulfur carrier subunit [Usitatibacter palustris]
MVTLLYFASLRESLACSREQVALPSGSPTVAALLEQLRSRDARWSEAFAPGKNFRIAVNQQMANATTALKTGDEIAFFPPVTGG